VATEDPVVFVTIDDGFYRTPEAMAAVKRLGWPVSSFVLPRPLSQNVPYFKAFGSTVEFGNHTYSHASLKRRSLRFQRHEICRGAGAVEKLVGVQPVLFRPPFGAWDENTVEAAKSCGMRRLVLWKVVVSGSEVATWGGPIRRGDIILLHYRPSLAASLKVLDEALRKQGLRPALLGDYLK
jgi:peptidoglycan/xylan/chitin deacetylase (PgdA/CDA1 family)